MSSIEKSSNPILEEEKKSRRRFAPRTPSNTPPVDIPPSNAPSVWTKQYSEKYKEYYFYNNVTEESVWVNTPEGMAIAKMLKGSPPQEEEKLKIIVPTPPSTPPPAAQNKVDEAVTGKFEGEWPKVKEYNPFKPPRFDETGWPIFSQSSDEPEKEKSKKPSSDDKLG